MLMTDIKKIDHNETFCTSLRSLGERSPDYINSVISNFSPEHKKFVSDLLQTRKIIIAKPDGGQEEVSRKLVKVKRRIQPGSQAAL
jgi:hypothetical protein